MPAQLSIKWSLSTHLEHEPLIEHRFLLDRIKSELLLRVVLLNEIQYDGTRLPLYYVCIGIVHDYVLLQFAKMEDGGVG